MKDVIPPRENPHDFSKKSRGECSTIRPLLLRGADCGTLTIVVQEVGGYIFCLLLWEGLHIDRGGKSPLL